MNNNKYILDKEGKPVLCDDIMKWGEWFEKKGNRIVQQDRLSKDVFVSTVFLGLDFSFDEKEPELFETMVFHKDEGGEAFHYATNEEALKGHNKILNDEKQKLQRKGNKKLSKGE
jgi:hypothetical protein